MDGSSPEKAMPFDRLLPYYTNPAGLPRYVLVANSGIHIIRYSQMYTTSHPDTWYVPCSPIRYYADTERRPILMMRALTVNAD
jgi:hypothetical protein